MIYDILIAKLEALGYVQGQSLFTGTIPGEINRAVMLRVPLEGVPIDPYIPGRYKGPVQVVVRDNDPGRGARDARAVQKVMTVDARQHFEATPERGRVHLDQSQPRTLPVAYPRLESNIFEWAQTFDLIWGIEE